MTKVLVTGASGFVAKHIVRELLERGYEVRGSIRSERRKDEVDALFPDAGIEYAMLDLNADAGWAEALDGVDVLMHTASPFPSDEPKDRMQLIEPAVHGTLRALRAAHAAEVSRVILTSSCAAIYKDSNKPPEQQSTADHWTDPDADSTSAYEASKTLAERAAWNFVEEHPEMQLTVINPGTVFGPAMDANYGTSLELVEQLFDGKFPMYPDINLPVVDVRDVAHMHVAAIDDEAAIGRRFPANAGALTVLEAAEALKQAYPDRKIPVRKAPDVLVKLMGYVIPVMKQAAHNLGRNGDVDGSAAEHVFDFTYIPSRESLLASAAFIAAQRP
ncbi:MAG: NAD-dependent epimerase/dehydratase family protein [Ilumatobacter sp.]|nr:NAD-dependent epimerase/dehydratase family protein [Ilumatobacter sp.]